MKKSWCAALIGVFTLFLSVVCIVLMHNILVRVEFIRVLVLLQWITLIPSVISGVVNILLVSRHPGERRVADDLIDDMRFSGGGIFFIICYFLPHITVPVLMSCYVAQVISQRYW